MNGCQNLNSRRASRGDYEKVVNQYPTFCASSSINLGGLCVCASDRITLSRSSRKLAMVEDSLFECMVHRINLMPTTQHK
jgi:hypothetical protein